MSADVFLLSVREELGALNRRIEEHGFLREAEEGVLPLDKVRLFVENQYYIVFHDMRSLAHMAGRAGDVFEVEYLSKLQQGDISALNELVRFGEELGIGFRDFHELRIIPESVAYTHYLSWLALYANTGEQVFALIVNLPVWGGACSRLGNALRTRYGLKNTGFLDGFANLPKWVEDEGLEIVGRYLDRSRERMRMVARLIQSYEASFWDGVYRGV